MNNDNLKKLAETMVIHGKKQGASQIQVSISSGSNFSVEILNGEIEKLNQAGSKALALKVIVDNKVATASTSDFNKETLDELIKHAIERAKLTSEDEYAILPENEDIELDIDSLKIYDESILKIKAETKIEYAKKIEKTGLAHDKIKTSSGSYYGTNYGEFILANSNGFSGFYKHTLCYAGGGFQGGSGDNIVEDHWGESSVYLNGLKQAEEIADKAVDRVIRMIGAKKVKSQVVPIVFDPLMTASLLGFLISCITGSSIYMNRSFLVNKLGTKIANEKINIIDNSIIPSGLGTAPFDSEGVPGRETKIIDNGVLTNYLLGTYSAKKLNLKSTGNASGPTNFYMKKGDFTPEEIIKSVDNGLYLTKSIGQGTMPTTGDISKGAYGIWIENGELTYPVAEITFSGNLGEMLNNIEMIGNDLEFRKSINGPTIKINNMTISGI